MKIETILTPAELPALAQRDLRATACVVFDVLRATSTFVTALHHGAQAIIPVSEIAEALAFKKAEGRRQKTGQHPNLECGDVSPLSDWATGRPVPKRGLVRALQIRTLPNPESILLGGERNGVRISADGIDFDLGNSPREYTPEKVRGKTIVSTTTNGTRALRACVGAKTILASSFLNLGATAEFLRQEKVETILLVCAGTGDGVADEDVLAAGALCELLVGSSRCDDRTAQRAVPTVSGSSQIALQKFQAAKADLHSAFARAKNGARLLAIPELRDDVAFCAQRDIFPLVARMNAGGKICAG